MRLLLNMAAASFHRVAAARSVVDSLCELVELDAGWPTDPRTLHRLRQGGIGSECLGGRSVRELVEDELRIRLVLVDEQPMAPRPVRLADGAVLVEDQLPFLEVFHGVTDSDDGGHAYLPAGARI